MKNKSVIAEFKFKSCLLSKRRKVDIQKLQLHFEYQFA